MTDRDMDQPHGIRVGAERPYGVTAVLDGLAKPGRLEGPSPELLATAYAATCRAAS